MKDGVQNYNREEVKIILEEFVGFFNLGLKTSAFVSTFKIMKYFLAS